MVTFDSHAPIPSVQVGGPLPQPLARKVQRIEVESQRNLPTSCRVELWDDDGTAVDSPMLLPGRPLTIEVAPASEDPAATALEPLFDGEIVALEVDMASGGGTRLVVCGYDKGHRLQRVRRTRSFLMQTDAIIVSTVAQDHGLAPQVDPTAGVHEYVLQHNQTDWEFVADRAREIGFEVAVKGDRLVFRRMGADPLAGVPQQLTRGEDLLAFRARASSAAQPTTTRVNSYNPVLNQEIQGIAPPPVPENVPGDPTLLPATVGASFGTSEEVVVDRPLDLQPAAMEHAMAVRAQAAGTAFEADGTCIGNPSVRAGAQVAVTGVGIRFSGQYVVSSARHVFDEAGYQTHFVVSGTHDRSLLGLTRPGTGNGAASARHGAGGHGAPTIGKVSDTNDPLLLGRVRVELPTLDPEAVSHWAPVVSAGAGADRGIQFVPEPGDLVLVVFEQGDLRRPYVLGGIWNSIDRPPEELAVVGGETVKRTITSRYGHGLEFDDTTSIESISLMTGNGASLLMMDGVEPGILLQTADERSSIEIDGRTGDVTITAGANMTIEATGNLSLGATGQLELSGSAGVSIDGGPRVKVTGAMVEIN